ncbi:ATPase domain-containing protein [Marinicrinis lubricantis]|uniref:ATPase domain-containing protein n=1 Tax=Marinicrinis lubricantis TaxID=2086470 RepID=A0ABW1IM71_9BACL
MEKHITTGIEGLDSILSGGFPEGAAVVVEGAPGTGKTTMGLQFLYDGAVNHEQGGIYITFEELPNQIYADAQSFGWDLRTLERSNQLRIVCISPELLMKEIVVQDGFFEQMVDEIGCRRLVIDSISLLRYGAENDEMLRKTIYGFRNILRKLNITSMFIREQTYDTPHLVPFENYVVDGVIRLELKPLMNKYRKRTLEVLKMRGTRITEGEHNIKFMSNGIHLAPLFSMVEDKILSENTDNISTGIPSLDGLLSGGLPQGSVFILDTNSKANYQYLLNSIYFEQLRRGNRVLSLIPGSSSVNLIRQNAELYDISLDEMVKQDRVFFIDPFDRVEQHQYGDAVFKMNGMSEIEYEQVITNTLAPKILEDSKKGQHWFVYYDLNTIFSTRGIDFVKRFFAEEAARARSTGTTILALCNFSEILPEVSSFLERVGNGVIRTWVDGNYQYLQITKSPTGQMSAPHMIESISEKPFIRLV